MEGVAPGVFPPPFPCSPAEAARTLADDAPIARLEVALRTVVASPEALEALYQILRDAQQGREDPREELEHPERLAAPAPSPAPTSPVLQPHTSHPNNLRPNPIPSATDPMQDTCLDTHFCHTQPAKGNTNNRPHVFTWVETKFAGPAKHLEGKMLTLPNGNLELTFFTLNDIARRVHFIC
eukprot:GHVT01009509.1.p1 GENE.GHVT01009509.1~~GHVT01009509.1.p1  ORF type:complete len:181 (-),score=21.82 GHVT01009509.1:884-1426(-)